MSWFHVLQVHGLLEDLHRVHRSTWRHLRRRDVTSHDPVSCIACMNLPQIHGLLPGGCGMGAGMECIGPGTPIGVPGLLVELLMVLTLGLVMD
jgi:hypothetical protein